MFRGEMALYMTLKYRTNSEVWRWKHYGIGLFFLRMVLAESILNGAM